MTPESSAWVATAMELDRITGRQEKLVGIDESSTVAEAAALMTKEWVGCLVVNSPGKQMTGILTENDIVRKVVAQGLDPANTTVGQVMTRKVFCCAPSTPVPAIQRLMAKYDLRHVPIVENDRAVGMVTSRDIHTFELATEMGE
jgi:CBS domain-containing protein